MYPPQLQPRLRARRTRQTGNSHDAADHRSPLTGVRILLISHDLNLNGAPLVLVELAGLLRRHGAEPEIALYLEPGDIHPAVAELCAVSDVPIVTLPSAADRRTLLDRYRLVIVSTIIPHPWVAQLLRRDQPEGLDVLCAGRIVWWIHELYPQRMSPEIAAVLSRVRAVVFDSHFGREHWRSSSGVALPTQSHTIYLAVDDVLMEAAVTAFESERRSEAVIRENGARRRTRSALGLGPDAFVGLTLAWLNPLKGVQQVIEAFLLLLRRERSGAEVLPPIHLLIVGLNGGPEAIRLEAMVGALDPAVAARIHLLPATAEVSAYFAAADVFVLNTLPPGEMFGRVLIEAMAHRLPVLASDRGGPVEVVLHNSTGWLHDPRDVAALADHVERLWRDPDLARAMGEAGFRRVNDLFTQASLWGRWEELLEDLLSSPVLWLGQWSEGAEAGPPAPYPYTEAVSCHLGDRIFLFGGFYRTYWDLNQEIKIYDLRSKTWSAGPALPREELGELARSHAGVATDGRWVFIISGQPGRRSGPACRAAWALHLASGRWLRLPDLPVARYGPACCYWDGKLHLFGGDREDRTTLSEEYWILPLGAPPAEAEPEDLEAFQRRLQAVAWVRGPDVPIRGDHSGHLFRPRDGDLELYLVGGEHGHAPLVVSESVEWQPGTWIAHPYLLRFSLGKQTWTRLADMPVPVHHIEHQVVLLADRLLAVLGGATHGSAIVDCIQVYDLQTERWSVHETTLPYGLIGAVAWLEGDRIHVSGGQTFLSEQDRRPGDVLSRTISAPYAIFW